MALVKKGQFFMAFFMPIKFKLSLVITFMAFYDLFNKSFKWHSEL